MDYIKNRQRGCTPPVFELISINFFLGGNFGNYQEISLAGFFHLVSGQSKLSCKAGCLLFLYIFGSVEFIHIKDQPKG
jgi:hypothetical protein